MSPLSDMSNLKTRSMASEYKDSKNRDVTIPMATASAPYNTKIPETITNNFEVMIGSNQKEFSKLTKLLILLFFIMQTILYIVLIMMLHSRISYLEQETTKLARLSIEKEVTIQGLSDKIKDVRNEFRDMTLECNFYGNSTESDDKNEHWIEVEIDYYDGDDYDESEGYDRENKAFNNNEKQNNQRNGNKQKQQQRGNKMKGVNRKRFVCKKWDPKKRNNGKMSIPAVLATDISAGHFKGSLPEVYLQDRATIGPWRDVSKFTRKTEGQDFELEKQNSSVLVLSDGYYFIYAQVYYLSSGGSNSYSIIKKHLNESKSSERETLATCSSVSVNHTGQEISCFTATVSFLRRNDRLQLIEREMNRHVLFRDGQTYFGLMRLSPENLMSRTKLQTPGTNLESYPTI